MEVKTLSNAAFRRVLQQIRHDSNKKYMKKFCTRLMTMQTTHEALQIQSLINTLAGDYKQAELWLYDFKLPTYGETIIDFMTFVNCLKVRYEMDDLYSAFALCPILYCKVTDDNKFSFYSYEWKAGRDEYRDMTPNVYEVIAAYYGNMILYLEDKHMILSHGLQPQQIVKVISDATYEDEDVVKLEYL